MRSRDEAMLDAVGMKRVSDDLWVFRRLYAEGGRERRAVTVVRRTGEGAFECFVPMVDDPVVTEGLDAVPARGLRFVTDDVRDAVAMVEGEKAAAHWDVEGVPVETGFADEDDDVFITMPFNGGPWSDYAVVEGGGPWLELADPADVFGRVYVEWRDAHCLALLEAAQARSPGPM